MAETHDEILLFQKYIYDFLQVPDIKLLVLARSSSGQLQPTHTFPPVSMQSKSCYFMKTIAEAVTKTNFREILTFGDVGANLVDDLAVLVQEV
jgi:hypothetical protein